LIVLTWIHRKPGLKNSGLFTSMFVNEQGITPAVT
jgi:hypothetical protein